MRLLKQCLQALLPAPSLIYFYQIPLVPRPLLIFRSSSLTESLEQAKWTLDQQLGPPSFSGLLLDIGKGGNVRVFDDHVTSR